MHGTGEAEIEKALYEAGKRGIKAMEAQAGKKLPAVSAPAYFPQQSWTVVLSSKGLPKNT